MSLLITEGVSNNTSHLNSTSGSIAKQAMDSTVESSAVKQAEELENDTRLNTLEKIIQFSQLLQTCASARAQIHPTTTKVAQVFTRFLANLFDPSEKEDLDKESKDAITKAFGLIRSCITSKEDREKDLAKIKLAEEMFNKIRTDFKDIAEEVDSYFNRLKDALHKGENALLPGLYHATKEAFEKINQTQVLKRSSDGATGSGVYVSSQQENVLLHGDHAFALEFRIIAKLFGYKATRWLSGLDTPSHYEENIKRAFHDKSVYFCFKSPLPVNRFTVAHLIVPNREFKKGWRINEIPVLSQKTSDLIHYCLVEADRKLRS